MQPCKQVQTQLNAAQLSTPPPPSPPVILPVLQLGLSSRAPPHLGGTGALAPSRVLALRGGLGGPGAHSAVTRSFGGDGAPGGRVLDYGGVIRQTAGQGGLGLGGLAHTDVLHTGVLITRHPPRPE